MVNPVIAADGHSYEYSAIMDWFSLGSLTSPKTNLLLSNTTVRPNHKLRERISMALECNLSAFLEYYLFEILLIPNRSAELDPNLANDFIMLVASETPNPTVEERFLGIFLFDAGRIRLLREILKITEPKFQKIAQEFLTRQIQASIVLTGHLDTSISMQYATVVCYFNFYLFF